MDPADQAELTARLSRLGFSGMEAAIYLDLLRHPGSTGYGIGKSLKKPHANVYPGLIALEEKGAVLFEDGPSRTYTAVAPAVLLEQLRTRHEEDCAKAGQALAELEAAQPSADRFYQLTNRIQIFSRARAMLKEAKETVLIESTHVPMSEVRGELEDCLRREVSVAGIVMGEADLLPGSKISASRVSERILAVRPGEHLTLIVDARQFLVAQFDAETGAPRKAVWADSTFVSFLLHNGIVADSILHSLPAIEEIKSPNLYLLGRMPSAFDEVLRK